MRSSTYDPLETLADQRLKVSKRLSRDVERVRSRTEARRKGTERIPPANLSVRPKSFGHSAASLGDVPVAFRRTVRARLPRARIGCKLGLN